MTTLHAGGEVKLHVVAQVVETEFVVRAVGDVGGVSCLPFEVIHVVLNTADFESEKTMDLAHPLGVAGGEVVVHSYDVNAAASGQRIQIRRQSSDESFALAGAHLGNLSLVENDAADQLHVEMAHAGRANTCFAHDGECFRKELVENLSFTDFAPFFVGDLGNCALY